MRPIATGKGSPLTLKVITESDFVGPDRGDIVKVRIGEGVENDAFAMSRHAPAIRPNQRLFGTFETPDGSFARRRRAHISALGAARADFNSVWSHSSVAGISGRTNGAASMRRSNMIVLACLASGLSSGSAKAETDRRAGPDYVDTFPRQIEWTASDRTGIERGKLTRFSRDDGNSGWGVGLWAMRSGGNERDGPVSTRTSFHAGQADASAWHAIGERDIVGLNVAQGKVSRRRNFGNTFPAKTRATFASAEIAWSHATSWSLSGGWFRQGGPGGHALEDNVLRLLNGEPAAAQGIRAALWVPVDRAGMELGLDARRSMRSLDTGVGAIQRRVSDLSLTWTSKF